MRGTAKAWVVVGCLLCGTSGKGIAQAASVATGKVEFGGVTGRWARCFDPRSGAWSESFAFPLYGEADGFDGTGRWVEDRSGGVDSLNSPEALTELRTETVWHVRCGLGRRRGRLRGTSKEWL